MFDLSAIINLKTNDNIKNIRGKEDGIYLEVQWLRLCASTAGVDTGSISDLACYVKKKKKEEREGGFHFDLYIVFLFIMPYFYQ